MNVKIEDSWKKALGEEFEKDYFRTLVDFVKREYASSQVFPPGNEIFAAFDATPFDRVKVVILGQDPYHGEHQANGLCFSVNDGIPFPPSLLNIFKEIKAKRKLFFLFTSLFWYMYNPLYTFMKCLYFAIADKTHAANQILSMRIISF